MTFRLVKPSLERLPGNRAALECGWSRDNVRPAETVIREQLEKIAADPAAFVASWTSAARWSVEKAHDAEDHADRCADAGNVEGDRGPADRIQ